MRFGPIVAATTFSLVSGVAHAATSPLDLSSGSGGFANTPVAGGFIDSYTFTVTTPSVLSGSLITAMLGNRDVDFTSIRLTGPSGVFSFTQLNADPFESYGITNAVLGAGNYTLDVQGVNSAGVASYGGNVAITPTSTSSGVIRPLATGPLDLSSGSVGFFGTPTAGGFVDLFTFTLVTPTFLSGAITSVVSGTQDIDFASVFLTGPSGVFSFTQMSADPTESYVLPASPLAAGNYTLTLIGVNSPSIASYGGTLTSGTPTVQAVPEPDTAALLLLPLVTAMCRRRRRSRPTTVATARARRPTARRAGRA